MGRIINIYICDQCHCITSNPDKVIFNIEGDEFCSLECKVQHHESNKENTERNDYDGIKGE